MKYLMAFSLFGLFLVSCNSETQKTESNASAIPLVGTWKMLEGLVIQSGDTTVTDYTKDLSFIKVINESHFAFFNHDLKKGKDSANAVFVSGGGSYTLKDSTYTEHLEYCSARDWEGHDFSFTVTIKNDTLIQSGVENAEGAGVTRYIKEKYVRIK